MKLIERKITVTTDDDLDEAQLDLLCEQIDEALQMGLDGILEHMRFRFPTVKFDSAA
jgi:hypothetical protein